MADLEPDWRSRMQAAFLGTLSVAGMVRQAVVSWCTLVVGDAGWLHSLVPVAKRPVAKQQ